MSEVVVAVGFLIAGGASAFFVPGRPSRVVLLLAGLIAGFSVSTSLVILQRLVLNHFFEVNLLPTIDSKWDLFALAGVNAATFLLGFVAGEQAERFLAPWKAAQRRAAAEPRPLPIVAPPPQAPALAPPSAPPPPPAPPAASAGPAGEPKS